MNFVRQRMSRLVTRIPAWNEFLFERHLLITNTFICGISNVIADAIVQKASLAVDDRQSGQTKATHPATRHHIHPPALSEKKENKKTFDWDRNLRLGAVGVALGPMCHYWYIWLDRRIVGASARAVAKKLLLDTGVFSPVYIVAYHTVLVVFHQESFAEFKRLIPTSGLSLFTVEWLTAPLQALNFLFVPTRYRVLFENIISFSLDMTYSHFVHKDFGEESKDGGMIQSAR